MSSTSTMKSNSAMSSSSSSLSTNSANKASASAARKPVSLPPETVEYLKAWMMSPEHIAHPYPTEQEKAQIRLDTGIELKQLTNWFVNNRKRFWKPRIEQGKKKGQEPKELVVSQEPPSSNHQGHQHHHQPETRPLTLRQQAVATSAPFHPSAPSHEDGDSVAAPADAALALSLPPSSLHNHRRHSLRTELASSSSTYTDPHTVSEEGSGSSSVCEDYSEEEEEDDSTHVSSRSHEGASSSESATTNSLAGEEKQEEEHSAAKVHTTTSSSNNSGSSSSSSQVVGRGSYCRHEEIDLFIIRPESNHDNEEPLPTLRDLTIRPSVPRNRILATFKCPISYEIPYEIEHDKRKVQSRRDGEVLRIKKHYLKLYLATRGICSASSPVLGSSSSSSSSSAQPLVPPPSSTLYQERVSNTTVTPPSSSSSSVSSSVSSSNVVYGTASSSSHSAGSLHQHYLHPTKPTPSTIYSTTVPRRSSSSSKGSEQSRKRARTTTISGEEEWRTRCQNAKSFFCETLPGLEEAAWMFGYRSNDGCLME